MYQRIFVAVDSSPTSTRGLDEAIGLGRVTGARLLLAHVVDELVFSPGFEPGATRRRPIGSALPHSRRARSEPITTTR